MSDLRARLALDLIRDYPYPEAVPLVLRDFVQRLQNQPDHMIIWDELQILAGIYQPDTLLALIEEASAIDQSVDITKLSVDRALGTDVRSAMSIRQVLENLILALPKMRATSFCREIPRLLALGSWDFHRVVCGALWVAGDSVAEIGLIDAMKRYDYASPDSEAGLTLSSIVKALGTCGNTRSVPEILDYLRLCPFIPLGLHSDSIVPLLMRGVLEPGDLLAIIRDVQAHVSGRITCLLALESIDFLELGDQVALLALDPTEPSLQRVAVRILGFSQLDSAISVVRTAYSETKDSSIRAEAAEALGRLGDASSVEQLERDLVELYLDSEYADKYVIGLSNLGAPTSLEAILKCLEVNRSLYVQHTIIESLGPYFSHPRVQSLLDDYLGRWLGPDVDVGEQLLPLRLLATADPLMLLSRVLDLYSKGILANSAREAVARMLGWLHRDLSMNEERLFIELIVWLVSDKHLPVREIAGSVLSSLHPDVSNRVFNVLWSAPSEWQRYCAALSLAYAGDEAVLLEARGHEDLLVRRAADTAIDLRHRRAAAAGAFPNLSAVHWAERLTAYYLVRDHGDEELIRSLLTCEEPSVLLYRGSLIEAMEKRLKDERKKRAEEEKKAQEDPGSLTL